MSKTQVNLTITSETYEQFRQICRKEGLYINRQVEIMMEDFIKRHGDYKDK